MRYMPKGPCAQTGYTLALEYLYRDYFNTKVHTVWAHGPLIIGLRVWSFCVTIKRSSFDFAKIAFFFRNPNRTHLPLFCLAHPPPKKSEVHNIGACNLESCCFSFLIVLVYDLIDVKTLFESSRLLKP